MLKVKDLPKEKDHSIRAIARCIAVLQAVNRGTGSTLTEIADSAGIPHPTATRIIKTLIDEGMIEREPNRKRYRPTALVQTLSCGFQNHDRLTTIARPHIMRLTEECGWPVSLVTRVGQAMVVRVSTSPNTSLTFNNYYPGWQVPLLPSASGRVYFSFAPAEEQAAVLKSYRASGGVDLLTLRSFESGEAGRKIREQGYEAASRTSYDATPGKTSTIAVPLFEGEVLVGSLAMIFFASAMSMAEAIERLLLPLKETALIIGEDLLRTEPDHRQDMSAGQTARSPATQNGQGRGCPNPSCSIMLDTASDRT